jgi:hypothetical protein
MGSVKANSGMERDRKGLADAFSTQRGVWGRGLLAGDLVHIHSVSSSTDLALFGRTWKDGTSVNPGQWIDIEVRQEPSAYFINTREMSKHPHSFDRGAEPLLAPDLSGAQLIGATSQGPTCHTVIKTAEMIYLRSFRVDHQAIRHSQDLYLHPAVTKGDKTVIWDMGIASNGSQIFIFGRDEDYALYLSKRDMGRQTHFQYMAERHWSHIADDLFPLMSNAQPLISHAPVSMAFDGKSWVLARKFSNTTTFWSSKHPRRGWSLVPGQTEEGRVRFQQATTSLDSESQHETAIPYSVSNETVSTFETEIKNFILPRNT